MNSDFAEWLSPMVVKELRQGLRSRLFVVSFLLVHGAMIFVALLGLALSANQVETSAATGFFWGIVGISLLLIMPMSGLGAVGNERKANTLELIFLTRLTARRILLGKWLAIVAQTALLVCAILPYAVLRYFLGGVNVGAELVSIVLLLCTSALLSGVVVGLSPQFSGAARTLIVIALYFLLQMGAVPLLMVGGRSPLRGVAFDWMATAGLGVLGLLVLLLMLEFGASRIAPPAENHSTSRRLIALGALVLIGLFVGVRAGGPILFGALALLVPICIGAICEPPAPIASVYRPFVRRGFVGKLLGRFLYPGWPSGVLFTLAVLLILLPLGYFQVRRTVDVRWLAWICLAVAGALYFPAALIRVFWPRARRPGVIYVAIQVLCALPVAMASLLAGLQTVDFRAAVAIIPTCGLFLVSSNALHISDLDFLLPATSLVLLASLGALLVKMRPPWRQIRALEKIAAAQLPPPPANATDSRATA